MKMENTYKLTRIKQAPVWPLFGFPNIGLTVLVNKEDPDQTA